MRKVPERKRGSEATQPGPEQLRRRLERAAARVAPPARAPAPNKATLPREPGVIVNKLQTGETAEEASAAILVEGVGMNVVAASKYSQEIGSLDLTECMIALTKAGERVEAGNLGELEKMLAAQATTLNAMFTKLASLAAQMTLINQMDIYTRLAFKAQTQCRATVETLALIKGGPRTVFARQANIAAGPQQVNNVPTVPEGSRARAGNDESAPIKLLEEPRHVERVDGGTAAAAGRRDQALATLGAVNGSADRRG
jgi:hypothetical protein